MYSMTLSGLTLKMYKKNRLQWHIALMIISAYSDIFWFLQEIYKLRIAKICITHCWNSDVDLIRLKPVAFIHDLNGWLNYTLTHISIECIFSSIEPVVKFSLAHTNAFTISNYGACVDSLNSILKPPLRVMRMNKDNQLSIQVANPSFDWVQPNSY